MKLGRWVEAITTPRDAHAALGMCSLAFALLGVLQAAIGVFISLSDVLHAGVWVVLALVLRMSQSRWISVIPLFAACISLANTLASRSDGITGSTNVGLMALVLWFAIRAVQASFALHHLGTRDTALFEIASVSPERCPRCGVDGPELGLITQKWRCKTCGSCWGNQPAAS